MTREEYYKFIRENEFDKARQTCRDGSPRYMRYLISIEKLDEDSVCCSEVHHSDGVLLVPFGSTYEEFQLLLAHKR